jgi:hypothetical protein
MATSKRLKYARANFLEFREGWKPLVILYLFALLCSLFPTFMLTVGSLDSCKWTARIADGRIVEGKVTAIVTERTSAEISVPPPTGGSVQGRVTVDKLSSRVRFSYLADGSEHNEKFEGPSDYKTNPPVGVPHEQSEEIKAFLARYDEGMNIKILLYRKPIGMLANERYFQEEDTSIPVEELRTELRDNLTGVIELMSVIVAFLAPIPLRFVFLFWRGAGRESSSNSPNIA